VPETGVTGLLIPWNNGDPTALDRLMPLVYEELRRIARRRLSFEDSGHTLQSTALVHEAYLRLIDQDRVKWQNRAYFFAVAAQMIRRILVDHARERKAAKRGTSQKLTLDESITCQCSRIWILFRWMKPSMHCPSSTHSRPRSSNCVSSLA
jgi:RNA polymerase sigma factor (TIGR02999 family)